MGGNFHDRGLHLPQCQIDPRRSSRINSHADDGGLIRTADWEKAESEDRNRPANGILEIWEKEKVAGRIEGKQVPHKLKRIIRVCNMQQCTHCQHQSPSKIVQIQWNLSHISAPKIFLVFFRPHCCYRSHTHTHVNVAHRDVLCFLWIHLLVFRRWWIWCGWLFYQSVFPNTLLPIEYAYQWACAMCGACVSVCLRISFIVAYLLRGSFSHFTHLEINGKKYGQQLQII